MKWQLWLGTMLISTVAALPQSMVVPGVANPWLSGMPAGTTASKCIDSAADTAPMQSTTSRDYARLSPQLKQRFFIGNGRTSAQRLQVVVAPPGAARLFLGVMDGCGWSSNRGSFTASVFDLAPTLSIRIVEMGDSPQVEVCWKTIQSVKYQAQINSGGSVQQWTNFGGSTRRERGNRMHIGHGCD